MIVVTGGAGYVGSHIVKLLGEQAIVVDDLRNSQRPPPGTPGIFIESNLHHAAALIEWEKVLGVIHCAGSISPRESVDVPARYWENNVAAALAFFSRVPLTVPVVFSSSCAVYGAPETTPITEETPTKPISPYGRTKLVCEMLLSDLGFNATPLRYFNPAGGIELHQDEIHLIPRAVQAALHGETFTVYGDGRQVRDFVHVEDLAMAHLLALTRPPSVYNLGSGKGHSVNEVIAAVEKSVGQKMKIEYAAPHPADPEILVADITKAQTRLGWSPKRSLQHMVDETVALKRNL